jgi:phosphoserine phosphatase RsbU/P
MAIPTSSFMSTISNLQISFLVASPAVSRSMSDLRWQVAAIAIGAVLLTFGLSGIILFCLRPKLGDRSLIFFSVFASLYAIRLIIGQNFFQSLVAIPPKSWLYTDLVIDDVIVVPLTLFLGEIVESRWKAAVRWVLALQIVFLTARFLSQVFNFDRHPMEAAYHIVIAGYCGLLLLFPFFSTRRGQGFSRELKAVYAGLAVFAVFVIYNDLLDVGLVRGRNIEPIGFLVLVGCLGYVAALRTFSNEQRLLSIQKELEIARQIQSSILPRGVPQLAGLEIAARYLPMTEVAGDFYDFILVDEKRVGILVADVTGHGVPAALIASMLKSALGGQSAHAADPGKVLSGLNIGLCGKFETHFVTAGYLFVDTENQILRYAAAGHPPLLFRSSDSGKESAFREIESNGLLLGFLEDTAYNPVELPFRPGDRCLLYTDGILEAKNPRQEEFGMSRMLAFAGSQNHLTAGNLVAAFLTEITRWSERADGQSQEDDITMIALDFRTESFLARTVPEFMAF